MTEKLNTGRPTKYRKEYVKQTFKLCLLGATDKELADFFDVNEDTIYEWKKEYPEFSEAIKGGKEEADATVASKLYHRAIGYEHTDTQFATYQGEITDQKEYTKHYPPDTVAAIFWLKNRQKAKWRDKQEVDLTGKMEQTNKVDLSGFTIEQLKEMLKE